MPPRTKKTRSSAGEAAPAQIAPPEQQLEQVIEAHTPEQSVAQPIPSITAAQRQALIDNLQLEITERARKLRGQYALQAQGLRARLEMRVNRIPTALRKRKMQDLLDEQAGKARPAPAPPLPAKNSPKVLNISPIRGVKRMSDQIGRNDDDKENARTEPEIELDLPMPKKRAKTGAATANTKASRTISRKAAPPNILSPRSHNSRTLPKSPIKSLATSPSKPHFAHISPAKQPPPPPTHSLAPQSSSAASSRAPSRQTKQRPLTAAALETGGEGRSSEASNTSAGTTIIHKGAAKGRTRTVAKAAVVATKSAGAGPVVTKGGRKAAVEAPAPAVAVGGGRTLRKR
ncbi:hypothetical protein LTR62_004987 [Meristemomyces frigidus]|uniref:Borealin N-terminal domain-containing protein n=1 Tax=Meristemomyces frigidus TaxID=1508187 RepID=A0AAN7TIX9_9PEZI|nr:hypothetical protein LTR62_004987 [Meristemomyces frigidus]